jgi:hypothetical protein
MGESHRTKRGDREEVQNNEESTFEPAPVKKRRRKRKSVPEAVAPPPPAWAVWIDPAALLWIPVLAPLLALTLGGAIFSANLPDVAFNSDPGETPTPPVKISYLFTGMCAVLAALPIGYLLSHWSAIAGAWALGKQRDPPWPDFDVVDLVRQAIRTALCAIVAAIVAAPLLWIPPSTVGGTAIRLLAAFVFSTYFIIAILATTLLESDAACNPLCVLAALIRMNAGRGPYLVEVAAHLAIAFGFFVVIGAVWTKAMDVGILLWFAWWFYAVPAGSRLMRVTGMYYAKNAKNVGWFR